MHYVLVSPIILQISELPTVNTLTKNGKKNAQKWPNMSKNIQKWQFLGPQMVKIIPGIPTANTLTKNGQKWAKRAKNGQKWLKMDENGHFWVPKWSI